MRPISTKPPNTRLPAHLERALAVAADADPRTIRRFLAGQPVRGLSSERIARALRKLGIQQPLPTPCA